MKNHRIVRRLGLILSAAGLALLTACGGGGENAAVAENPVVAPAAAPTVCGITPVAQQGAEQFHQYADQRMTISGLDVEIALLTSPNGYSYDGLNLSLSLPMKDLRGVMLHGYPEGETQDSMGVEMGSQFAAGSVGCVAGVSRVFEVNGVSLMSWASAQVPSLPVDQLSSVAVNGFEYMHNFGSKEAMAVFRMSKVTLADPSSAAICHIASNSSVDCATPDVRESANGEQWEFRLPITASGVYMLSAEQEQLM